MVNPRIGVLDTMADEGERGSIGRPTQLLRSSLGMHDLHGLVAFDGREPDLAAFYECDVAIPGNGRRVSFRQFFRRAAVKRDDVNSLLRPFREALWIGNIAMRIEIAAAGEYQRTAIGGPGELSDILTIVVLISSQAAAL